MNDRPSGRFHAFANVYRATALVLLNAIILFGILNFGAALALKSRPDARANAGPLFLPNGAPVDTGRRMPYHLDWFDFNACQGVEPTTMGEVLDDFFDLAQRGFLYEPWCQFTEPPFAGRRVQVTSDSRGHPIRATVHPSDSGNRPKVTLFCFGGSTTFGYHVADEQTWPSWLASALHDRARRENLPIDIEVTNYGRGIYYPSQELALFIELLRSGQRPDLALFLDGVNLGPESDTPRFTDACAKAFGSLQGTEGGAAGFPWKRLPLIRWFRTAFAPRHERDAGGADSLAARPGELSRAERADQVCRCFRSNWRLVQAIGNAEGIETLICLQPDAIHDYPLERFRVPLPPVYAESREVRKLVHADFQRAWPDGVVDLTQLFVEYGPERKAVLDDCHYTPDFNRFVAERIADRIDLSALASHAEIRQSGPKPTDTPSAPPAPPAPSAPSAPSAPFDQPVLSGPALGSSGKMIGESSISR